MSRWGLIGLTIAAGALALAVVRYEAPFPSEPRDDARALELQRSARVILITLDGPLRDDVLSGPHMPVLQAAVRAQGIAFPASAASPIALSLPGYQAIAAGTLNGCADNDCARIAVETMAERIASALHLAPEQAAVFASWAGIHLAASSRDGVVFVDAPQGGPAQEGGPPWPAARFDAETFARARAHWQQHHPRFLHLAFLDTDEYAHDDLRAEYEQALRDTDARLEEVLGWVKALPPHEAALTTVLLTSDHGRGKRDWTQHGLLHPGSGEIFIAAIGPLVRGGRPRPADQRDLRPTVERLYGLCPSRIRERGRALEPIVGELPCLRQRASIERSAAR